MGQFIHFAYAAVTHPTSQEGSANGGTAKFASATKEILENWSVGLQILVPSIQYRGTPTLFVLYGENWTDGYRMRIPEVDLSAGLSGRMCEQDGWAKRVRTQELAKRCNITITVSKEKFP